MRHENTTTFKYQYENEAAGFIADLVLQVRMEPGDPGDWTTPPTPDEYELMEVTVENIEFDEDMTTREALRHVVEAMFIADYESQESEQRLVEEEAAHSLDGENEAAYDAYLDFKREQFRERRGTLPKPF